MISLTTLWLPILLSAIIVFVVSSVIHMVFTYHNNDFKGFKNEDDIMDALRPLNLPPGEYVLPKAESNKERQTEAFKEKINKGPIAFINVFPNGTMNMGINLLLWFLFSVLISLFSGYLASATLTAENDYLKVFQVVGTSSFMGYSFGLIQSSIWYRRPWSTTLKSFFDGLLYALLTAGTFGWLWP